MTYWQFHQNNSGGSFIIDESAGISVNVIIEADSSREANGLATDIGLYFDGDGDCSCCGNRWSEVYDYDGDLTPTFYGADLDQPQDYLHDWANGRVSLFVHHRDRIDGYKVSGKHFVQVDNPLVVPAKAPRLV